MASFKQSLIPLASRVIRAKRAAQTTTRQVFSAVFLRPPAKTPVFAPQTLSQVPAARLEERGGPIWSHPALVKHKLWNGFSTSALHDLTQTVQARKRYLSGLNQAAWTMAEWYAVHGDFERARAAYSDHLETSPSPDKAARNYLIALYCAVRSGDFETARLMADRAKAEDPGNPNLPCAFANACAALSAAVPEQAQDPQRLEYINMAYAQSQIAPLQKKDPHAPLSITNLCADVAPASVGHAGPKVSVIVPVYNGQETLGVTLDGLLAQSWANLEILVVDDCSTDATAALIARYAARDGRITALRNAVNSGSYTARNLALSQASGDLVTVHDANDWSHPQKIEQQARHLQDTPEAIANHTQRARVDDNLLFLGKFRHKWQLVDWDPSSFMIRTPIARDLGGWDRVRISADAEFVARVRRKYGEKVVSLPKALGPLAFAYEQPGSLTSDGPTHGRTIHHGVRREYGEASRYWHSRQAPEAMALPPASSAPRVFPVPGLILPERQRVAQSDVLLVGDFNAGHPLVEQVLEQIEQSRPAQKIALFQWRYYALDTTAPLDRRLRAHVHDGTLLHLVPGEQMQTERVIVLTPDALAHRLDNLPELELSQLDVVFGNAPSQDPDDPLYAPLARIDENLHACFGTSGQWYASTQAIQTRLQHLAQNAGAPARGVLLLETPQVLQA